MNIAKRRKVASCKGIIKSPIKYHILTKITIAMALCRLSIASLKINQWKRKHSQVAENNLHAAKKKLIEKGREVLYV